MHQDLPHQSLRSQNELFYFVFTRLWHREEERQNGSVPRPGYSSLDYEMKNLDIESKISAPSGGWCPLLDGWGFAVGLVD